MNYLEWAQKGVDDLEAIIMRLNEKAVRVDAPFHGSQIGNQTSVSGVPLVFIKKAEEVVANILLHVSALDAPIHDDIAGRAPEWWQQVKRLAVDQRNKDRRPSAFANAVTVLDRHASDETVRLLCIAFLVNGLELHIVKASKTPGFRSYGEPNTNGIDFIFDFQVNANESDPVSELAGDVPELQKACVPFFRSAVRDLVN